MNSKTRVTPSRSHFIRRMTWKFLLAIVLITLSFQTATCDDSLTTINLVATQIPQVDDQTSMKTLPFDPDKYKVKSIDQHRDSPLRIEDFRCVGDSQLVPREGDATVSQCIYMGDVEIPYYHLVDGIRLGPVEAGRYVAFILETPDHADSARVTSGPLPGNLQFDFLDGRMAIFTTFDQYLSDPFFSFAFTVRTTVQTAMGDIDTDYEIIMLSELLHYTPPTITLYKDSNLTVDIIVSGGPQNCETVPAGVPCGPITWQWTDVNPGTEVFPNSVTINEVDFGHFRLSGFVDPVSAVSVEGQLTVEQDGESYSSNHCLEVQIAPPPMENIVVAHHSNALTQQQNENLISVENEHWLAFQGRKCGTVDEPFGSARMTMLVEEQLPEWATRATVWLNGWQAKYLGNTDHHVANVRARVHEIWRVGDTLRWHIDGRLVDKNRDDSYSMCVDYVVVGWNHYAVDLRASHGDVSDHETIIHYHHGVIQSRNPDFRGSGQHRWLPRGFDLRWEKDDEDHHLYEVLYNLRSFALGRGPNYDLPFANFADDDKERDYRFQEWVSQIDGSDLYYVDDPMSLNLHVYEGDGDTCFAVDKIRNSALVPSVAVKVTEYEVSDLPMRHAVPVLAGWDLWFPCGDEHVEAIAARVHDAKYTFDQVMGSGTLRYKVTTELHDKDDQPGHNGRVRVDIMGLALDK